MSYCNCLSVSRWLKHQPDEIPVPALLISLNSADAADPDPAAGAASVGGCTGEEGVGLGFQQEEEELRHQQLLGYPKRKYPYSLV